MHRKLTKGIADLETSRRFCRLYVDLCILSDLNLNLNVNVRAFLGKIFLEWVRNEAFTKMVQYL